MSVVDTGAPLSVPVGCAFQVRNNPVTIFGAHEAYLQLRISRYFKEMTVDMESKVCGLHVGDCRDLYYINKHQSVLARQLGILGTLVVLVSLEKPFLEHSVLGC